MSQTRQLAAIMFTDIVGYTALMDTNEELAFAILQKNRSIHKPLIELFHGKFIKEMGDGILASFTTVSDAVYCAGVIQKACENEPDLNLRIGINLGEIMFQGNDVFGSGVNIASRIEAIAPAGGIWVSDSVQRNIQNKKGIAIEFVKEETLKNVKQPVRIYSVNIDEAYTLNLPTVHDSTDAGQPKAMDKSIAILPFVNMSNDADQEYFCDGLAEELLNILAQNKKLNVASRTSAFSFKGKNQDISLIGEKLRVRNVLEGSVRKAGTRIRITAQLIDVKSGYHLWSEKYDRQMDDIFAIQDEIAQAIADRLNVSFGLDKGEPIINPSTENFQAYDSYLKGRYLLHRMDSSIKDALGLFQSAIDLDANFAHAYAGMGATLQAMGDLGIIKSHEVFEKANKALDHALELNPKLADAHVTKAWINAFYDWDINQAEKHISHALKLDSNSDTAHARYSAILSLILQNHEKAIAEAKKAVEINPLDAFNHFWLHSAYLHAHKFDMAHKQIEHALTLDPNSFLSLYNLGILLRLKDQVPDAIRTLTSALNISGSHPWALAELGICYFISNEIQKSEDCLSQMIEINKKVPCAVHLSILCGTMQKFDLAFDFLEEAFQSRQPWIPIVLHWPSAIPLRSDPRFEGFVRRVGILPPEMKGNDNLLTA